MANACCFGFECKEFYWSQDRICFAEFDKSGSEIIVGTEKGQLEIYDYNWKTDTKFPKCVGTNWHSEEMIFDCKLNQLNSMAFTTGNDNTIKSINLRQLRLNLNRNYSHKNYPIKPETIIETEYPVNCIQILDNDKIMGGSLQTYSVNIWDIQSQKITHVFREHKDIVTCVQNINENIIVSSSLDKSITFWDIRKPTKINKIKRYPSEILCFDICDKYGTNPSIVAGYGDSAVISWDFGKSDIIWQLVGHDNACTSGI